VIEVEKDALTKLVSLLKDKNSTLILIEPTEKMTVVHVKNLITGVKSWWYYKGLVLWAKAREGKSVSIKIFETLEGCKITHNFYLDDMVRVSYIKPL